MNFFKGLFWVIKDYLTHGEGKRQKTYRRAFTSALEAGHMMPLYSKQGVCTAVYSKEHDRLIFIYLSAPKGSPLDIANRQDNIDAIKTLLKTAPVRGRNAPVFSVDSFSVRTVTDSLQKNLDQNTKMLSFINLMTVPPETVAEMRPTVPFDTIVKSQQHIDSIFSTRDIVELLHDRWRLETSANTFQDMIGHRLNDDWRDYRRKMERQLLRECFKKGSSASYGVSESLQIAIEANNAFERQERPADIEEGAINLCSKKNIARMAVEMVYSPTWRN